MTPLTNDSDLAYNIAKGCEIVQGVDIFTNFALSTYARKYQHADTIFNEDNINSYTQVSSTWKCPHCKQFKIAKSWNSQMAKIFKHEKYINGQWNHYLYITNGICSKDIFWHVFVILYRLSEAAMLQTLWLLFILRHGLCPFGVFPHIKKSKNVTSGNLT